ncbi:MAG: hypothetical protein Ct9H90mP2_10420 [Dehalococcoidia bacterium]|nr:MAG: hypothetical protein Ct9H90mP2_10420 [Dehalococcoidia bacterium]
MGEEKDKIWVAIRMGVVSKIRLSDGRVYDAFRVPHPVQVHGMTIRDNVLGIVMIGVHRNSKRKYGA